MLYGSVGYGAEPVEEMQGNWAISNRVQGEGLVRGVLEVVVEHVNDDRNFGLGRQQTKGILGENNFNVLAGAEQMGAYVVDEALGTAWQEQAKREVMHADSDGPKS